MNIEQGFQHHNVCIVYYPKEAKTRLLHVANLISFREYLVEHSIEWELHPVNSLEEFVQLSKGESGHVCVFYDPKEQLFKFYYSEHGENKFGFDAANLRAFDNHDMDIIKSNKDSVESKNSSLQDLWIIEKEDPKNKNTKAILLDKFIHHYGLKTKLSDRLVNDASASIYDIFFNVVDFLKSRKLKTFEPDDTPKKENKKVIKHNNVVEVNQTSNTDEQYFDYGFDIHPDATILINYWNDGIFQIQNKDKETDLAHLFDEELNELRTKLEKYIIPLSTLKWVLEDNINPLVYITFENLLDLKSSFFYASRVNMDLVLKDKKQYYGSYQNFTEKQWNNLDAIGLNMYDLMDLTSRRTAEVLEVSAYMFLGKEQRPDKKHKLFTTEKGVKMSTQLRRKLKKKLIE